MPRNMHVTGITPLKKISEDGFQATDQRSRVTAEGKTKVGTENVAKRRM